MYSHVTDEPTGSGFTVPTSHSDFSSVGVEVPIVVKDENETLNCIDDDSHNVERPTHPASLTAQHCHTGVGSTRQRRTAIAPLNSSRNSLPTMAEGYRPTLSLSENRPPLPPAGLPGDSANEDCNSVSSPSVQSNVESDDSIVGSPTETSNPVSSPKPSSTANHSHRPKLCSLRQISIDRENLPSDMSEIELLTGDIHSPVLSYKSQAPQKVSLLYIAYCG